MAAAAVPDDVARGTFTVDPPGASDAGTRGPTCEVYAGAGGDPPPVARASSWPRHEPSPMNAEADRVPADRVPVVAVPVDGGMLTACEHGR